MIKSFCFSKKIILLLMIIFLFFFLFFLKLFLFLLLLLRISIFIEPFNLIHSISGHRIRKTFHSSRILIHFVEIQNRYFLDDFDFLRFWFFALTWRRCRFIIFESCFLSGRNTHSNAIIIVYYIRF